MTPPDTPSSPRAVRGRRRRRLVASAATALASLVGVVAVTVPAGVASAEHAATHSNEVAAGALEAMTALAEWEADQHPADYVLFVHDRDTVAEQIATELGIDPGTLRDALASAPIVKQHVVLAALSQLGTPYRRNRSEPGKGFDCSGLTTWAYAQVGVALPRNSSAQIRASVRVDRSLAQPGDLVHYPGHVAIYVGAGLYVHAPQPGRSVEVIQMPDRRLDFGTFL